MFKKLMISTTILSIFTLASCSSIQKNTASDKIGVPNPASTYCHQIGGKIINKKDSLNNELGYCKLPNGKIVEEWELYRNSQQK